MCAVPCPTPPHGCTLTQSGRVAASGQNMGVHHTGECFDEVLLCSQKTHPQPHSTCAESGSGGCVENPISLRAPLSLLHFYKPSSCLPAGPLPGDLPRSLPRCGCGLQNSEGHSDRKRLVAFCVCESHSPAEQRGGDRLWLGESTYKQAWTCVKVPIPAKPPLT